MSPSLRFVRWQFQRRIGHTRVAWPTPAPEQFWSIQNASTRLDRCSYDDVDAIEDEYDEYRHRGRFDERIHS